MSPSAVRRDDSPSAILHHHHTMSRPQHHEQTRRHTLFRPCIDIHDGKVKQIVGGTLSASDAPASQDTLRTNFVSSYPPSHYATLYKEHNIEGGHVIMLGRGNADAAREALRAWPGESRRFAVRGSSPVSLCGETHWHVVDAKVHRRSSSRRRDYG